MNTHRNIQLHPHFEDRKHNANDLLWHSKHILSYVYKAFVTHAHCVEFLFLDELALATKCHTRAKRCLLMKSDPHSLRFYGLSVVSPKSTPCLF